MLDVEERLLSIQLTGMLLHQFFQTGNIIGVPMGTNEVIALYGLEPNGCIILPKVFLPHLSRALSYTL